MGIIASVNVNGIRAAFRRGMGKWLEDRDPIVMCLQEVRAKDEILRSFFADADEVDGANVGDTDEASGTGSAEKSVAQKWHVAHSEPKIPGHAGRAGVAIVSRVELLAIRTEIDDPEFDTAGRWVEADISGEHFGLPGQVVTVASVYVHTGEAQTEKQLVKHRFLDAVSSRIEKLTAQGNPFVICGDVNIAHHEADLKNWRGNLKRAGFLPDERAVLDHWLGELGVRDVVRELAGPVDGPYSWWTWRGQAFDNDTGWRIDYHYASPDFAEIAADFGVDRADSWAARFSDHAPVWVKYHRPIG